MDFKDIAKEMKPRYLTAIDYYRRRRKELLAFAIEANKLDNRMPISYYYQLLTDRLEGKHKDGEEKESFFNNHVIDI